MILPTKHIPLERSLLGAGAVLLQFLDAPLTPTAVWDRAKYAPEIRTYGRFVLALDFLYAVGAIDMRDGLIVKSDIP
jgi:hypothetical protein